MAMEHVTKLFRSLKDEDFAYVEVMPQKTGGPRLGDVYGKKDAYGLWFIKFEFDGSTTTVILSCHEAEHDIELADGRTLRSKR